MHEGAQAGVLHTSASPEVCSSDPSRELARALSRAIVDCVERGQHEAAQVAHEALGKLLALGEQEAGRALLNALAGAPRERETER